MSRSRPVFSTEYGRLCPECGEPVKQCVCGNRATESPAGDSVVTLARETKGRKGKDVTVVRGLPLTGDELKRLAKRLKQRCGTGGTVKAGTIEIQGDRRDTLQGELEGLGYRVKKAGG